MKTLTKTETKANEFSKYYTASLLELVGRYLSSQLRVQILNFENDLSKLFDNSTFSRWVDLIQTENTRAN